MKVWGITPTQCAAIVARVSAESYGGNVEIDSGGFHSCPKMVGRAYSFCLRVKSSRERGARESGSGRRTVAASWHAHRDVMRALFAAGATRIKTSLADYRGAEDFERKYLQTSDTNVGSNACPRSIADCSVL